MINLYTKEWEFFKSSLVIKFGWVIQLSALFTGLFYFAFMQHPGAMQGVMAAVIEKFKEEGLLGLRVEYSFALALKIFYLNLRSTLLFTVLGFIPFLLGAILFLILLPVLLGVSLAVTITKGYDFYTFFKLTAPHGIFELVAVFYGVSLGIYLSKEITKKLLHRFQSGSAPFFQIMRQIFKSYVIIIIPLLALAAIIEVFVTPLLK